MEWCVGWVGFEAALDTLIHFCRTGNQQLCDMKYRP